MKHWPTARVWWRHVDTWTCGHRSVCPVSRACERLNTLYYCARWNMTSAQWQRQLHAAKLALF